VVFQSLLPDNHQPLSDNLEIAIHNSASLIEFATLISAEYLRLGIYVETFIPEKEETITEYFLDTSKNHTDPSLPKKFIGGAMYTKDVTKIEIGPVEFSNFHLIGIKSLHKGGKATIVDAFNENHRVKQPRVVRKVRLSSLESKRLHQNELPMYQHYDAGGDSSQYQEPAAVAFLASPITQLMNQVSGKEAAEIWNDYERIHNNTKQLLKQSRNRTAKNERFLKAIRFQGTSKRRFRNQRNLHYTDKQ